MYSVIFVHSYFLLSIHFFSIIVSQQLRVRSNGPSSDHTSHTEDNINCMYMSHSSEFLRKICAFMRNVRRPKCGIYKNEEFRIYIMCSIAWHVRFLWGVCIVHVPCNNHISGIFYVFLIMSDTCTTKHNNNNIGLSHTINPLKC